LDHAADGQQTLARLEGQADLEPRLGRLAVVIVRDREPPAGHLVVDAAVDRRRHARGASVDDATGLVDREAERDLAGQRRVERESAAISMETLQAKIAASTACHAAIKVNMPLDQAKMEWLLSELARTDCPMSCPHGRPVVLRYSLREIERAFKRI
jgi:hypothetical protein